VIYVPSSIVYHASGATASKMQEKARLYFYVRNHFMVLLKNYNLANAFKAIAVSFLFEIRNVLLFLIRRRPLVSASILRALIWNLVYLRRTWAKRSDVQGQVRKVSDERIKQQMLVPKPMFPLYLVSQDKRSRRIGKQNY
jgi:GT2 family glycosyltransferase